MMMMAPVAVVADVVRDLAPGILAPLGALGAVLLPNLGPVGAPVLAVAAVVLAVTLVGLPIGLAITWLDCRLSWRLP
jgi:hypothetical protein